MKKIEFRIDKDILYIAVEGRIDASNAPEFESFLKDNIVDVSALVINCEKLAYISSAGLRVLKKTYMAMAKKNGTMELSHVNKMVMEVLEMTGFSGLFRIV